MLDTILPLVKKPIRYTGGEYNIMIKKDATVHVGVVFPEVYEIGMSNLGIKIIYHLFNAVKDIQCERIFAPWPDFGGFLKNRSLPLYGLETQKPVKEFDLLGFSLQSELCYTTVLYLLDICGMPFRSCERDRRHPLLIAGGPAVLNPCPLSPVFDAFVIGDGEEVIGEIADVLKAVPRSEKGQRLARVAAIRGVWVPALHGYGPPVQRRVVPQLDDRSLPSPHILPICDITHDRLPIEVMRGCTWGCRFCQAGYVNRPVRIRPADEILRAIEKGIRETGWEEVSLQSFSILDYPDLLTLIRRINAGLRKKMINVSLPAMRGELFSEDLAVLLKEIKKTGLTFAPETASDRLRSRLNKSFSNDRLIHSIHTAYQLGWKQVKLYFMIGLPFEQDSDIDEIGILIDEILRAYPRGGIKCAVNAFIPKPHTPFENIPFAGLDQLHEKIKKIRALKKKRVAIKYQEPGVSFIETVLSRADADIFPVIEKVYSTGGRFEEWREGFDLDRWERAFDECGVDPHRYLQPYGKNPWDFIDTGVSKDFLKKEFQRAQEGITTENCMHGSCSQCGACDGSMSRPYTDTAAPYNVYGRYPKRKGVSIGYRVKYSIGEPYRYASHLDTTRTIYRALRRSDLPIQFTQGFSPIPKVSFCPPKSVGQITKGDYFDFWLNAEHYGNISIELNMCFPHGIRILEVRAIHPAAPSLSSVINLIYYEVEIPREDIVNLPDLDAAQPVYCTARSGTKNMTESLESFVFQGGILTCGLFFGGKKVTVYELLSHVTGKIVDEVKMYKVTRTSMFVKRDGLLLSPMEAM
jgi:radical SAM family uncharacterized protein/radical SAM-linked protein